MSILEPIDGYRFSSVWLTWFCIPGRVILWLRYMFPSGGFAGVAATGRQARSPIMAIGYSIAFYLAVIGLIGLALSS